MEYVFIALGAVILFLIYWAVSTYNQLVRLRNECDNSWHQIDVQLKRRFGVNQPPGVDPVADQALDSDQQGTWRIHSVELLPHILFGHAKHVGHPLSGDRYAGRRSATAFSILVDWELGPRVWSWLILTH